MKILIASDNYPMADRSSGDLRFYNLMKILSEKCQVYFSCLYPKNQIEKCGEGRVSIYKEALEKIGVTILNTGFIDSVRQQEFDAILFEFFHAAATHIKNARFLQPRAIIIVDSVDVHFQRLFSKAKVTKKSIDFDAANRVKHDELAVYNQADIVLVVSEDDKKVLLNEKCDYNIAVVPNIHFVPPLQMTTNKISDSLIFVGSFTHEPNIDAMIYFCREIFPLIKREIPTVSLKIIGNSPTDEVVGLANEDITVLGYVPDTRPFLESSCVSIAPLRYGAGMKGKIGEALSFGVPVVTTPVGMEGFGLTLGENILMGETPQSFADEVIRLLREEDLYEKIRVNGRNFIYMNYSEEAVARKVALIVNGLKECPVKKLSFLDVLIRNISENVDRYLLWRIKAHAKS